MDENYDMFHLVLSFLYTERICFATSGEIKPDPETLMTCDAEGVYAISGRLKLPSLQSKAFHFMQITTDLQNITSRVFGEFASKHPGVEKWYDEYFKTHRQEILVQKEYNKFMDTLEQRDLKEEGDLKEFRRVMAKYRKLT